MTENTKINIWIWAITLIITLGVSYIIVTTPENWPACASEDSDWCTWTGNEQGNGLGSTVINYTGGYYITM